MLLLEAAEGTNARASYFGLLAFVQLLALMFVVLVDDLQPCRWFHASALVSWQLLTALVLLLDALPQWYYQWRLRNAAVGTSLVVAATADFWLLLWLATAWLRDESHTSLSRCLADNGQVDFVDRQDVADLFLGGMLVVLLVCNLFGLYALAHPLRCDPGALWCRDRERDALAWLTPLYGALLVGIFVGESLVANGYVPTGAYLSWQLPVLLVLPFAGLGSPEVSGAAWPVVFDGWKVLCWLGAALQSLLMAFRLSVRTVRHEDGSRSCPYQRQLYGRERASVIAQLTLMFSAALVGAGLLALAIRVFLRSSRRLERPCPAQ